MANKEPIFILKHAHFESLKFTFLVLFLNGIEAATLWQISGFTAVDVLLGMTLGAHVANPATAVAFCVFSLSFPFGTLAFGLPLARPRPLEIQLRSSGSR